MDKEDSNQLWQFLLRLLIDPKYSNIISWVGDDGTFKFVDAEKVSKLWGEAKNRPNMTYSTLTRALRYYYSSGLIEKVDGYRYLYKFLFDFKCVVGYTVKELNELIERHQ